MFKFKIVDSVIIVMIILILDKLYLLPLYVPLNSKPDNRRSAAYLAKSIAKEAKCDDTSLALINFNSNKKDTILEFGCMFDTEVDAYFNIYIFLDDKSKSEMIKNRKKNNPYNYEYQVCFKKGDAYMICEPPTRRDSKGNPMFNGEKYYKQFPGEYLEYGIK